MDFAAAAEMMRNMSPEQLKMMQESVAKMSPAQLQQMAQTARSMGLQVPDDPRELEKVKDMDPKQFSEQAGQAANLFKQQSEYKFKASQQLKQEGNEALGRGNHTQAIQCYERAIANLQGNTQPDAVKLLVICHTNAAKCHMDLNNFNATIDHCSKALANDPNNTKALYRRGLAREKSNLMVFALSDLQLALKFSTGDDKAMIQAALERVEKASKDTAAKVEEVVDGADDVEPPRPSASQPPSTSAEEDKATPPKDKPAQSDTKAQTDDAPASVTTQKVKSDKEKEGDLSDDVKDQDDDVPSSSTKARVPLTSTAATTTPATTTTPSTTPRPSVPSPMTPDRMDPAQMSALAQQLQSNPQMLKSMSEMLSNMDDAQLEAMTGAMGGMVNPQMAKTAAKMMSTMDPTTLQAMMSSMPQSLAASGMSPSSSTAPTTTTTSTSPLPSQTRSSDDVAASSSPTPVAADSTPAMPFEAISKLMSSLSPDDMKTMMEMSSSMAQGGKPSLSAENIAKISGIVSKLGPENLQAMSKLAGQSGMLPQQAAGTGTTAGAAAPQISQSQANMILMAVKAIHVISSSVVKINKFLRTAQGRAFVVAMIALVVYYVLTRWFGLGQVPHTVAQTVLPTTTDAAYDDE